MSHAEASGIRLGGQNQIKVVMRRLVVTCVILLVLDQTQGAPLRVDQTQEIRIRSRQAAEDISVIMEHYLSLVGPLEPSRLHSVTHFFQHRLQFPQLQTDSVSVGDIMAYRECFQLLLESSFQVDDHHLRLVRIRQSLDHLMFLIDQLHTSLTTSSRTPTTSGTDTTTEGTLTTISDLEDTISEIITSTPTSTDLPTSTTTSTGLSTSTSTSTGLPTSIDSLLEVITSLSAGSESTGFTTETHQESSVTTAATVTAPSSEYQTISASAVSLKFQSYHKASETFVQYLLAYTLSSKAQAYLHSMTQREL